MTLRTKVGFVLVGITLLLAMLAFVLADRAITAAACDTTVFSEVPSPDKSAIATVEMTDCGATTGFSRVVMVRRPGVLGSKECRALALKGTPTVKLSWDYRGALAISHDARKSDLIYAANTCFSHEIQISGAG